MVLVAEHVERQHDAPAPGMPAAPALPGASIERGAAIAERGVPEERVAACSECHGSDLTGDPLAGSPDLSMAAAYELADFSKLMRTGKGAGGRDLGLMSEVAKGRFAHFTEDEIAAIHAYLVARSEKVN